MPTRDADVDLTTTYLGLALRSPLVASSGPLTCRAEPLRALQDHGIGAVVLPSLFAEQLAPGASRPGYLHHADDGGARNTDATAASGKRYLRHVAEAHDLLDVPVIASLNGVHTGDWIRYARGAQDAGADALELNLYDVVVADDTTSAQVEARHLAVVADVRAAIDIPLAVKVSPYYTAFAAMARRLVDAGADGLVLFNRFYQPDVDPGAMRLRASLHLSHPSDMHLPLRWTALLADRLEASLAISGGVHRGTDVASAVLAGADVAMMTSVLLDKGPLHITVVEADLASWVRDCGCTSVADLRGRLSRAPEETDSERDHYVDTLVTFTTGLHDSWRTNPY